MTLGNQFLDAAVRYAQMGLSVIPLHGKKPYWENWPEIATTDTFAIAKWWLQEPTANVGIATGRKSGIFVLDVDPKNGGQESFDSLLHQHGALPRTWVDITGSGGTHYYFRYPAFAVGNKAGLLPGIDIRGNGGQVVAPPSIHPDTHRAYSWDGLHEPWDEPTALSDAPLWLLDLLNPQKQEHKRVSVPLKIPKGVQHWTLVSLAGMMRRAGLSPAEIYPSLMEVNNRRCQEPGPEKDIRAMAQRMQNYQPNDRNLFAEVMKLWRQTRHLELKAQEQAAGMRAIDGLTLFKSDINPMHEIIEGMLYNGITLLAGPPKSGKSYLTLCMAISVACGGRFLSQKRIVTPGRVSYFALEESERRTASRLRQLVSEGNDAIHNIEFLYRLKSMDSGGMAELESYLASANPSLLIIDTLMAFVTGDRNSRSDVFRQDYREIKQLQDLANRHNTAILVVHHTNKVGGHGVGAVAGTHGVTAAADCIWTMQRQPQRRAILEVTGREVEEQAILMELELREPIGWMLIEEGDDVVLSQERQDIIEILRIDGDAKTPRQLATEIGKSPMATRQLMRRMLASGLVVQDNRGSYRINQVQKNERSRYESDTRD